MRQSCGSSDSDRELVRAPRPALFRRMRVDGSLQITAGQCLRMRSRYSDCEKCAQACPPRVLRVSNECIELADGCLRCAQCCAACPTDALKMEGLAANRLRISAGKAPLYMDCWKVAASESPRDAVRVPCLGGIALRHLVRWHAASAGRRIVLIDRGWCGQCSAGRRADHPAQGALEAARALLAGLGAAEEALPRLESLPLPRTRMPADIPEPPAAQPLSRRAFFAAITRRVAGTTAPAAADEAAERAQPPRPRLAKAESTARSQLIRHASVLAARHGRRIAAELFPALRVSDTCRNHHVCTSICPTAALRAYRNDDDSVTGIVFDAAACIACGDCVRACPEQALTLFPQGDGEVPGGATELTRWTLRECHDCGDGFADFGSSDVCPTCRKTRELARADLSRLFSNVAKEPA